MASKGPEPRRIDISKEVVDALLNRVTLCMEQSDAELIKAMADTLMMLNQSLEDKSLSLRRFLKMTFGHQSEKAMDILEKPPQDSDDDDASEPENSPPDDDQNSQEDNKEKSPKDVDDNEPSKRNGRLGTDAYTGAKTISCELNELKHKDLCPLCGKGKVYKQKPKILLRFTSKPPVSATKYERERFRCNTCGAYFTADLPDGVDENERYDEKVIAMMALLHYGTGMPFYRLEKFQKSLGIPLPTSTQWDIVSAGAFAFFPIIESLMDEAANGELIHNDDTTAKILELMGKRREKKPPDLTKHKRKGMYTTGIISHSGGHRISLFCTGTHHAGENLEALLMRRKSDFASPIQMCDGLSQNLPGELNVILSNCLAHSRRKFVEIYENFPEECRYVILKLLKVYRVDAVAKKKNMTPDQRLKFHQKHSLNVMKELKEWMNECIDSKVVEPNSGLGQAMNYALKRWEPLTLFLRKPGAPLDNNICERALKKSILTRKNSLFYLTETGARTGDLYMSIIHTCELEGVNPFEYMTSVMKNHEEVAENPNEWMPWNFKKSLQALDVV